MLLVIDVGNTNTVLGVYKPDAQGKYTALVAHWRVSTTKTQTTDEYGVLFRNLFSMAGIEAKAIDGIIISSVVPPMDSTLRQVCERYFHTKPLFIEPGVKTGMPVLYDNPAEVGADRIVNGVAAFEKYGGPCVVVDFGTATTFDVVSAKGEYMGGMITPGIGISADALFANAEETLASHFESKSQRNKPQVSDPKVDEQLSKMLSILDENQRLQAALDIQKYLAGQIYQISTYSEVVYTVIQPWVHNYFLGESNQQSRYALPYLWLKR